MRSLFVGVLLAAAASAMVIKLTNDNFDKTVNEADIILVKFFAPWCGHCKHLAPEYEKASETLAQDDIPVPLAEVDATVEEKLAQRFGVTGYPTLKIFRKGAVSDYNGPREADGIIKFMRTQAGPSAKILATAEAYDKFVGAVKDDVTVIGYFTEKESAAEKAFMALASALREDYRFGKVTDKDLIAAKNGGKEGVFVLLPYEGEEQHVREVPIGFVDKMTKELHKAAVPVAGVYKADYAKRYEAVGLPRVTAWTKLSADDPSSTKYVLNRLRKAAKEFKGKAVFVVADKSDKDFGEMGFADAKVALGVISNGRYKGADAAFSVDSVKKLTEDFLAGKLERHIKSEPIPEKNDEDVRVLVGKTFEEEVIRSGKDTFVLFYAPWCGHCKSLHPKYEEMATKFKNNKDIVTIAKIDATANEYPPQFQVHGFPTLYFVKASDPKNPIQYNGEREAPALEAFVRENASKKIPKQEL